MQHGRDLAHHILDGPRASAQDGARDRPIAEPAEAERARVARLRDASSLDHGGDVIARAPAAETGGVLLDPRGPAHALLRRIRRSTSANRMRARRTSAA